MTRQFSYILIIDDDPDDVEMLLDAVRTVDATTECFYAGDGEEAILMLTNETLKNRPDLIILDMNMPRMNGKQCLQWLKSTAKFADIPVIVYSTTKMEEYVNETRRLGAMNFITKPSRFSDLVKIVSEILAGKCVFQ